MASSCRWRHREMQPPSHKLCSQFTNSSCQQTRVRASLQAKLSYTRSTLSVTNQEYFRQHESKFNERTASMNLGANSCLWKHVTCKLRIVFLYFVTSKIQNVYSLSWWVVSCAKSETIHTVSHFHTPAPIGRIVRTATALQRPFLHLYPPGSPTIFGRISWSFTFP